MTRMTDVESHGRSTGTTVQDYSSSGNDCTGQYGLYQAGSGNNTYTTGDTIINWVEVALP